MELSAINRVTSITTASNTGQVTAVFVFVCNSHWDDWAACQHYIGEVIIGQIFTGLK